MAYSTISKPSLHFNTKLYTGTGSTQSITGVGFAPDWTWIKIRSTGSHHTIFDKVRGAGKAIYSDTTGAEQTVSGHLTSFDSDGFTLGDNTGNGNTNANGETFASWNWKANGAGSANTDGSITSTVSANTTAGFSIVKYVGTGSGSNSTVGHGLGVKPAMIINKSMDSVTNWVVWHKDLGSETNDYLRLDSNLDKGTTTNYWNSSAPTNQVFGVSPDGYNNNKSGEDIIAYCFAEKKGYSKFGSYTGNGNADGTFIYTGFAPSFVIMKRTDSTGSWYTLDNKRPTYNPKDKYLSPDSSNAESTFTFWDFLSNGFKIRNTGTENNASGGNYIFMAFAEEPLVANVGGSIPATAR